MQSSHMSPAPHVHSLSNHQLLPQRSTFVPVNVTHHYYPEAVVYIWIHSWCCTSYGFGQITMHKSYVDFFLPKKIHKMNAETKRKCFWLTIIIICLLLILERENTMSGSWKKLAAKKLVSLEQEVNIYEGKNKEELFLLVILYPWKLIYHVFHFFFICPFFLFDKCSVFCWLLSFLLLELQMQTILILYICIYMYVCVHVRACPCIQMLVELP